MRKIAMLATAAFFIALVTPAGAQQEHSRGAMLIILDASGSMNNVDEDGVAFIDKAKDAVLELIDALPDDVAVGLRVYGHREPNTDPVRGCQDTELLTPVVPIDRVAIRSAVSGVEASGFTPIGLSLQQATMDLPEAGPRSIVLISDGVDTCAPPDPCEVAEELYGDAVDVRIESIGFLIDTGSAAEQQLRCIAEASGGEYRTVSRADELIGKLGEVATDMLDWRPAMTLSGALEQAVAPNVPLTLIRDWWAEDPPTFARGEYVGLILPGETRWFQVDTWKDEWFWSFADLEGPPGTEVVGEFEAIIIDPSGARVEVPAHSDMEQGISLPGTDSPMIGVTNGPPPGGGQRASGTYLLGFRWDAPPDVFLGSLRLSVDILGDRRESMWTELEGSLDPGSAPVLEFGPMTDDGSGAKVGEFLGPIDAGETRWYRLETAPGEVVSVFAVFPADRVVGMGIEGEFGIEMRSVEGEPVGAARSNEYPQMHQTFGDERHQALVSGTTMQDPDPLPESILIGFSWDGVRGESMVRFEAQIDFDPSRTVLRDAPDPAEGEYPDTTAGSTATDGPTALDESEPGGDPSVPVLLGIGVAVLIGLIVVPLIVMRRRPG